MRNILIVVDMQNDFVTGSLGSAEARAILNGVAKRVSAFSGEVIFTLDTHEQQYLSTQEGRYLPVPHCIRESEGWELCPDLKPLAEGRMVVEKPGFGSVALAEHLKKENELSPIHEIVLIGVCTDICVISNALILKAFLPETRIAVDANLCAGVTPESHLRALEAMKPCQIDIL